ncbi:MAG: ribonuclease R [Rickettsiales bacterium]
MSYDSFPTRDQIQDYISSWESPPSVKEIARAFHIKREDIGRLKDILSESKAGRRVKPATPRLPPMLVVDITGINADGELLANPTVRDFADIMLTVTDFEKGAEHAKVGDRVLAKIKKSDGDFVARLVRVLPPRGTLTVLGMLVKNPQGYFLEPVYRKERRSFLLDPTTIRDARDGDLIEAEVEAGSDRYGFRRGTLLRVLGRLDNPHAASHIAIHRLGIPVDFPPDVFTELDNLETPALGDRVDLRSIPLITIDGEDARDFDDAVHAVPYKNGWKLTIAIADVAHYVKLGSPLDIEAQKRGNSVYFPDRVVPMLPEILSNGLCSLKPNEDRYCIAAHITIDGGGNTKEFSFTRGLMRSVERRTYNNIQEEIDSGKPSEIVANLYGAYHALKKHITERGPLELNLPEYKVFINDAGKVTDIRKVKRLDSHQLIEAYMVAANIAVADFLTKQKAPSIFRVHAEPDPEKLRALKDVMNASGYRFTMGNKATAKQFNGILRQAEADGAALAIHNAVLRTQMQAYYSPHNDGHFGLALTSYSHFTSPIRRYADLVVHRALIRAMGWGKNDNKNILDGDALKVVSDHISSTERRAMQAERDAMDRYTASFLTDRVGAVFEGHISGATDAGLFITLDETGAEGFVPKMSLRDDQYHYDKKGARLTGARKGRIYAIGQRVTVTLEDVALATGSIRLRMDGQPQEDYRKATPHPGYKKRYNPKKRRR